LCERNTTGPQLPCCMPSAQPERQLGSQRFWSLFRSITFDNGVEFSLVQELEHSVFTNDTRMTPYSAHPHCSSEPGTNENHNGMIRRFLPKGTNFSHEGDTRIREIQNGLNTCPRKIHNGCNPLHSSKEAFGLKDRTIELLEASSRNSHYSIFPRN